MNRKLVLAWAFALVVGFTIGVVAGPGYPVIVARWLGDGAKANTNQFEIRIPSSGASAIFVPGTTNTNALGSTALRFSNVFSVLGNFSGLLTSSGGFQMLTSATPRSSVTPSAVGQLIVNTTLPELCFSTGTLASTWVKVSTPTAACSN